MKHKFVSQVGVVMRAHPGVQNQQVRITIGIVMPAHAGIQNSKKRPGFQVVAAYLE